MIQVGLTKLQILRNERERERERERENKMIRVV